MAVAPRANILCQALLHLLALTTCTAKLMHTNGDQMDNVLSHGPAAVRISGTQARDWVKITEGTPTIVTAVVGERAELECEVLGAPAPEVQWLRGNEVVQQTEHPNSNSHLGEAPAAFHAKAGLAKIHSRLVIDCVTPQHEGFYTCAARAGLKTVKAPPTLLLLSGAGPAQPCRAGHVGHASAPRITAWNPMAMENMGVDVLLPCAAVGSPEPSVYWLDEENNLLKDYRFQVLANGDLAISSLSWADMGQYTCVAENSMGRDSVTSFLYPVSVNDGPGVGLP